MALWDSIQGKWSLSNGLYVDSSGNGNDLIAENSPASDVGHGGGASKATLFAQNGFTAKKDAYISDAAQTGLNITGNFTMAGWIKANNFATPGGNWIQNKLDYLGGGNYAYDWYLDPARKLLIRLSSDGTALTNCIGGTALSTGVWYHVAVVYDGTDIRIYLNASLDTNGVDNPKTYSGGIHACTAPFTLAAPAPQYPNNNTTYWDGVIDDFAVWSRALSSAEITGLYNLGDDFVTAGSISGVIEDQAGTVIDCSTYNVRLNIYQTNNTFLPPVQSLLVTSLDGSWSIGPIPGLVPGAKYFVTYEYEGAYAPLSVIDIAGAEFITAL